MALSILSNIAADETRSQVSKANRESSRLISELSTGLKASRLSDDSSLYVLGTRSTAKIAGLRQSLNNVSQAQSLLQVVEGSYNDINDILIRKSSLASQTATGTLSDSERQIINEEFQQLGDELNRISESTTFNGNNLIKKEISTIDTKSRNGLSVSSETLEGKVNVKYNKGQEKFFVKLNNIFQAAYDVTSVLGNGDFSFNIGSIKFELDESEFNFNSSFGYAAVEYELKDLGGKDFSFKVGNEQNGNDNLDLFIQSVDTASLDIDSASLTTQASSVTALKSVNDAIDSLSSKRSAAGIASSRLDIVQSNLEVTIENKEAANSNLLDVDIAAATSSFANNQVILQSGIYLLAHVNQQPNHLLNLIK